MTGSILKAVVCGVIVGVLAFFVPKLLVVLVVIMLIIRALHCGMGHGCYGHGHKMQRLFVMADLVRKMNDDEYADFKAKMSGGNCCNSHSRCGCGCKTESSACCEQRNESTK